MQYNFSAITDKEFETLCKDILENELGVKFQNFAKGKDKGIDLRYASSYENEIIVQAKYYLSSKFSDLKHKLISEEKRKLDQLVPLPKRYIVMTTLSLNPMQVDQLVEGLKPYVLTSQDIYGLDRITSSINSIKSIESKYFKLWLTSTNVLQRITYNAVKGRSEFYEKKIIDKAKVFVPTQSFKTAVDLLKDNKFIIITGEPGIGKTSIAYSIICGYLSRDFELIYISDSIKDAEDVLSDDPKVKQIVYFDDFLGSNLYEVLNPRNSENSIISLIDRILSTRNKYLVLTTRTTILNQAKSSYEKFTRNKYHDISKYQIELEDYDEYDRALILYNHLFHSNLPTEHQDTFFEKRNYLKIINHRNYSPRLIQFITEKNNVSNVSSKNYMQSVLSHFENPDEIWAGAYENQLGNVDRFLLLTLFSLGGYNIYSSILEKAFLKRLQFEVDNNGFQVPNNAFNGSLKKLLDGFISSSLDTQGVNIYSLINPSVGDFLINYLQDKSFEKQRILKSAFYIEQITTHFHNTNKNSITLNSEELTEYFSSFKRNAPTLFSKNISDSFEIKVVKVLIDFFNVKPSSKTMLHWLELIDPLRVSNRNYSDVIAILKFAVDDIKSREIILKRFEPLMLSLIKWVEEPQELEGIRKIFDSYHKDFHVFIEDNSEKVFERIGELVSQGLDDDFDIGSYKADNIVGAMHEGKVELARYIIEDAIDESLTDFLHTTDLHHYTEEIKEFVPLEVDDIIESLLEGYSVEEESYEYSPSIEDRKNKDYEARIENLFDRSSLL